MLAGVKIIPREKIEQADTDESEDSPKHSKSSTRKEKRRKKRKSSKYSSSDDELGKVRKGSKKKQKKRLSSDEYSSIDSGSEGSSEQDEKKHRKRRKMKKKSRSKRNHYASERSSSESDEITEEKNVNRRGHEEHKPVRRSEVGREAIDVDSSRESQLNIERKSMGLEWMLKPKDSVTNSTVVDDPQPEESHIEEVKKMHLRELNPYMKDNGSGYPEDEENIHACGDKRLPSHGVGDGGASWRMKAFKRAQEQAAREGRNLEEVAGERWGSLGQLAVSMSSGSAAPFRAHLHAINNRKRAQLEDNKAAPVNENNKDREKGVNRDYLKNVSLRHPDMKAPKARDSLSWGKRGGQSTHSKNAELISAAVSSLNKFENDGSFLRGFASEQKSDPDKPSSSSHGHKNKYPKPNKDTSEIIQTAAVSPAIKQPLSGNQLAAKVMQLRLKGKHTEAEALLKEADSVSNKDTSEIIQTAAGSPAIRQPLSGNQLAAKVMQLRLKGKHKEAEALSKEADSVFIQPQNHIGLNRVSIQNMSVQRKEEDADMNLAQKIVQNKKFSISGQADDEYDYDDGPRKKTQKKREVNDQKLAEKSNSTKRILTQQERCLFCFENPKRQRHLVVSIANFTYLTLPQGQPVVPGHCCILPTQHEASTRTVDNDVWEEIRNFKKCLIMMFAKQEREVVFLETVMGLAKQQRHCMIECVPLPRAIADEAPLYFKKAIDEAESEWSQHNAKRLIDTSEKGLRASIPKDFPYFHVEFGLKKGYAHVIDDEQQFKSSFGINIIRGMLDLPEEDRHQRRGHGLFDAQKKMVASFVQDWQAFDWTKQL